MNLGANNETTRRIARETRYPYKYRTVQHLHEGDFARRLRFARWIIRRLRQNPDFARRICFTDESTFTQKGYPNRQNQRCWAPKGRNPHRTYPIENQRRWKVLVWAGIVGDRIIGPLIINKNLTGQRYARLIRNKLPQLLDGNPIPIEEMWWQQDGAPAHGTQQVTRNLRAIFNNRIISNRGLIRWPARSPDLTPLDFWLWSYVKERCYRERPTTRDDMIRRIFEVIAGITPEMITNARRSILKRMEKVVERRGDVIEPFL